VFFVDHSIVTLYNRKEILPRTNTNGDKLRKVRGVRVVRGKKFTGLTPSFRFF